MKKYEEKEVNIIKKVLIKTVCDICKKEILVKNYYYEVTTGHNDWGNDSVESLESHDICSDECLKKEFDLYLESSDYTKHIEVERTKL